MAITLSKLLSDSESKYSMKLIAGKEGMENTVRWVHMVEDREVPDFLHGNELIFTTGIGHISGGDRLTSFVRNLKQHNAVGVVVNLGPYISYVPDEVIQYCNDNAFPIFTLPWEVHIIDITFDFCSRIIANEQSETSVAQAFQKVIADSAAIGQYIKLFEQAGFKTAKPFRLIAVELLQNGTHATERIEKANRMKLWHMLTQSDVAAATFVYKGHLIAVRQDCSDAQVKAISEILARNTSAANISYVMGVSEERCGYESIPSLYRQTAAAVSTGLCDDKQVVIYRDIGADKIICGIDSPQILDSYIEDTVCPILKYDAENHTEYFKMLKMYLESNCSVKAVAEQINVHRNTVNYQIKQIREIFALELDEQTKMNLLLALRILKLKEKGQIK